MRILKPGSNVNSPENKGCAHCGCKLSPLKRAGARFCGADCRLAAFYRREAGLDEGASLKKVPCPQCGGKGKVIAPR